MSDQVGIRIIIANATITISNIAIITIVTTIATITIVTILFRPQPSPPGTGLINTWTAKTSPSTWWSPTRQGSLLSRLKFLNQNTVTRPIYDPVGSKEEVAINQQLNSRREITAAGGSTEEVQMLNSKLWKRGDALQCCRCVHNF